MQSFFQNIKDQIWSKIQTLFNKYTGGSEFIVSEQIAEFLKNELKKTEKSQLDYVLQNLSRLDSDNSGQIDFSEFANYMLKRYCGEVALQEMHRQGLIKRGSQMLVSFEEFVQLLNRAYKFLGLSVDSNTASQVFKEADKDNDNHITYKQYFSFIEKYVCRANVKEERAKLAPVTAKKYRSRIREFIWSQLRILFNKYDQNKDNLLQVREIEALARDVIGSRKKGEFQYIIYNVFQLRNDINAALTFQDFASRFLLYMIELHLSKWTESNGGSQRLSQTDFISILRSAFSNLSISSVNQAFFIAFFLLLDRTRSGYIGHDQLNKWIREFLAILSYNGSQYYLEDDDFDKPSGKNMIAQTSTITSPMKGLQFSRQASPHKPSQQKSETIIQERVGKKFQIYETTKESTVRREQPNMRVSVKCPFTFSSHSLANRVRRQILGILADFDKNGNKQFEEDEIIEILQVLMKEDKNQVKYVIGNVFRYDKNNDKIVSYDELSNFFLQIHCGEIAIQRLHRKGAYKQGAQRLMDLQEFITTLQYALSFINITPSEAQLAQIFKEIDKNSDQLITYQEYFQFLRYYFGSQSNAALTGGQQIPVVTSPPVVAPPPVVKPLKKTLGYGVAQERFSKLVRTQTRVLLMDFDYNKNVIFQKTQIAEALPKLFKLTYAEANDVINSLYRNATDSCLSYDVLNGHLLELLYSQVFLKRVESRLSMASRQLLNLNEFIDLLTQASHFLPVKAEPQQLQAIFNALDQNNDDYVSFSQYVEFVRKWLGSRAVVHPTIQNFQPFRASGLPIGMTQPIR